MRFKRNCESQANFLSPSVLIDIEVVSEQLSEYSKSLKLMNLLLTYY